MEINLFAWAAYGAVVLLLLLLLITHAYYELDLLTKTRTNLSSYVRVTPVTIKPVDKDAERKVIQRRIRRSWYPYVITFVPWTVWMMFRIVNSESIVTYVALCVACAALVTCVLLFIRAIASGRKLKQSHHDVSD